MGKKTFSAKSSELNVGALIKKVLDTRKIPKSAVAREMNRTDAGILQFQKGHTMQVSILLEFSHAIGYNFFRDIADMLPPDYKWSKPVDKTDANRIKELEEENRVLKAEKALLLEVIKK